MKPSDLRPIPTAPAQWIVVFKFSYLPVLVFVGAILTVGFLWRQHVGTPTLVGQVEGATACGHSQPPGVLSEVRVARFPQVRAGEQIGSLLCADAGIRR